MTLGTLMSATLKDNPVMGDRFRSSDIMLVTLMLFVLGLNTCSPVFFQI